MTENLFRWSWLQAVTVCLLHPRAPPTTHAHLSLTRYNACSHFKLTRQAIITLTGKPYSVLIKCFCSWLQVIAFPLQSMLTKLQVCLTDALRSARQGRLPRRHAQADGLRRGIHRSTSMHRPKFTTAVPTMAICYLVHKQTRSVLHTTGFLGSNSIIRLLLRNFCFA